MHRDTGTTIEEQTMQKARKFIQRTLDRIGQRKARPAPASQPRPLDAEAQRLVGGGTATPSTPVKGW
ncbi:MAG TPA: hypothetical protein VLU41_13395 [Ideonella sp.]|nr:hypothetical protein [Ideonella sp.]